MKYTKMSKNIKNFAYGLVNSIPLIIALGLFGAFLWIDLTYSIPLISILWIILLPALGLVINWSIGHFFGDEYYNTGLVFQGRTVFDVVKTPKYYSRRMFVCFIECFLFLLLIVRFIFLINFNNLVSILGIISCIIAIAIYFIVGMSSYEQSSIKDKKNIKLETTQQKPQTPKRVEPTNNKTHKFKFDNYPQLLEKYNNFKLLNTQKYQNFSTLEEKTLFLNELNNSFENLANAVYDIFNEIKPNLIIKKTGKKVKWEDVINKPFANLSYIQKLTLVRLLDKLYKYVLPSNYYNY